MEIYLKGDTMKKVIRDNLQFPIGWTNTNDKKGTENEFCDGAGHTHRGHVAETMQSLNFDEREAIQEEGELF